jgi:mutator protein MutT
MSTRDVSVLVLYDHNKILLQKRSKSAKRFPNLWGLFGGGVEDKETPEEALKREIYEELELKISAPKFLQKFHYELEENGEKGNVWVYVAKYNGQKLHQREGDGMEWVTRTDAMNLRMHSIYRKIIEGIFDGIGGIGQGNISVVS